jgi:hypothetical protein
MSSWKCGDGQTIDEVRSMMTGRLAQLREEEGRLALETLQVEAALEGKEEEEELVS